VVLKPGEILKPNKLREAVKKADFTPGDIHIKAKGEIVANPDKETSGIADLAFKLPDSGQIFLLVSPPPKESGKKTEPPKTPDLLPKLREVFKTGQKKFTISGQVHKHQEFPVGLSVDEFGVEQEEG